MKKDMQYWAAHVAAIEREAIFASAYAKREGLSPAALYYWQRKLRTAEQVGEAAKPVGAFVQLRVSERTDARGGPSCTLVMASGVRLEMASLPAPEWLAGLARAIRGVF